VGGKNDARLVADIEKLIKVKIELEAVEFDDNLPDIRAQGRINDGRRMYGEGTQDDSRRAPRSNGPLRDVAHEGQFARPARDERAPRRDYTRPPAAPRDPFFDKPYEPSVAPEVAPSWESTPRTGARISANIKPKRRVAALFKSE